MLFVLVPVAGLALGSFANVVAYRVPRQESLVKPRSRCPACGAQVRAYDNIPVVSWLLLRGRCRDCGERRSPARYPLVEALMAILWLAVVLTQDGAADILLGLAFVTLLVPVAVIDFEHRIIPNRLLAPFAVAAVVILALAQPSELPAHLIAAAAAGGIFLLAALAYPRGMGMGDVKLAAVMGLYLGRAVAPALLAALMLGTLVGIVVIARVGATAGRKTAVPFGPFLAARRPGGPVRRSGDRRLVPRHPALTASEPGSGVEPASLGSRRAPDRPMCPKRALARHPPSILDMASTRTRRSVVGLDIEPSYLAAAQVRSNGRLEVERAATAPLEPGIMRDGEVTDADALADALQGVLPAPQAGQARAPRRRQPAHRRAHARPAAAGGPQGARRRGPLPGPGAHPDDARPRGAGLPAARGRADERGGAHPRRSSWPRAATWSSACCRPCARRAFAPRASISPPSR